MLEIILAGGWLMAPIMICSVLSVTIIFNRAWMLRQRRVLPPGIAEKVRAWAQQRELDRSHIETLRRSSPLGRVLAAALDNRNRAREVVKEAVEDTGRHVIHELERFLNTLGTIAGISPLLGLLGTVIGMIKVFAAIMQAGVGDPAPLAGGISEALITTAAGLTVAIPSFFFYRYFRGKIRAYVVGMEQLALDLINTIEHGNRELRRSEMGWG
jgi:biopolymer transport protein ExbB